MKKALNLLMGFVAGGLVGAALGILLAPESGRQLRSDIQNYGFQLRNEVSDAAKNRRHELEEQLARLRGEIISE